MYAAEFLTVALIHLLAVASPGPDFAVVVRESVTHGRRAGTWTALGVGSAIFLHVGYSLLGIGLIVSQSIVLFNALKWAAAAYLLYIGFKALRAQPAKPAGLFAGGPSSRRYLHHDGRTDGAHGRSSSPRGGRECKRRCVDLAIASRR